MSVALVLAFVSQKFMATDERKNTDVNVNRRLISTDLNNQTAEWNVKVTHERNAWKMFFTGERQVRYDTWVKDPDSGISLACSASIARNVNVASSWKLYFLNIPFQM